MRVYKWERILARGDIPESRDEHTAVIDGDSMLIFGGYMETGRTNDIFRYFFNENRWEKVEILSRNTPEPRSAHSAIMY